MTETNKTIFESIYQVFIDYGLIDINRNTEEKKQQAYLSCVPIIEKIQEKNNDSDIDQFLKDLMLLLDIDVKAKESLDLIFKEIIKKLEILKAKSKLQDVALEKHESTIGELSTKVHNLELTLKLQETRMIAFDLLKLFRFYFLEKVIKSVYPRFKTWMDFTDEWSARELQVINMLKLSNVTNNDTLQSDEVQLHPLVFGFIDPVQKKLSADLKMEIPLKIIREISNDRHRAAHSAIKSVIQQRLFIMKCVNYQYPQEYEFNEHLQKILNLIVELDTDPTTCKLKRFQ